MPFTDTTSRQTFSEQVRRAAQARGLKLLSIGYRNDWADEQWLEAGPHDFAHAIARAEAVATNFFHGCVFALRNAKPFVCTVTEYRSNKIRDLMAAVGGGKHLFDEDTPASVYDTLLAQPYNQKSHNASRICAKARIVISTAP
jgi:hypothetical protein